MKINRNSIKKLLDTNYEIFNQPDFIISDPVSIPHMFTNSQDIEIAAFLSATIAWGNRTSIIKNAKLLMQLMDNQPYHFIMHSTDKDQSVFKNFKHRTFNPDDCLFFIESLKNIYRNHKGLKKNVMAAYQKHQSVYGILIEFRKLFFSIPHLKRTEKHFSDVTKGAAAKRLNLFLRWMIRKDGRGVDFGIWNEIPTSVLMLPLDVHTGNVARNLGLLKRKQNDWQAVEEITSVLQSFDKSDPVKYDFALFGMGVTN